MTRGTDWREKAECANHDPNLWSADDRDGIGRASITKALRICNTVCTVQEKCLNHALANGEDEDIWGGMTARERKKLHR